MEEIRLVEKQLNYEKSAAYLRPDLSEEVIRTRAEFNFHVVYYIIQSQILAGLKLQEDFNNIQFYRLSSKLEQQLKKYDKNTSAFLRNEISHEQLLVNTNNLLITLNQLVLFHTIIRDEHITAMEMSNKRQNITLYSLLAVLIGTGIIITRRGLLAIGVVISRHQEAESKIRHQALFDGLTDLPNRTLALDRLNHQMNEARRDDKKVAVLFLDLDDFKKVNDILGHEIGDKLLIEEAKRLKYAIRSGDTVGRLGGDEFIIILGNITDVTDINTIAEKLIYMVGNAYRIDGHEIILTTSIGISVFPINGDNSSELLRNADSAMYHSKESGRNTYSYFTDAMNKDVTRRLALEEQIHGALERGEFNVYYQVKMNLTTGLIMGAEALLRWHNPALGNVSPDEFIPIAEQTGLIVPIGQFVLTEALRMTASWQKNHIPDFFIAVNVSPRQFRDPKLISSIKTALQNSGIANKYLELEITEGVLMSGHSHINKALNELHNLGVSIAMDDFGTGYSSLSYLRSYPFDVVKIDRSFVRDIVDDLADRELIKAAISMTHSLNLKVVAEGIENQEQHAYLTELNCDFAQGYLFGKPVPAEEFTATLNAKKNTGQRQVSTS